MLNFSLTQSITQFKKHYIEIIFFTFVIGLLFYLIYSQTSAKHQEGFEAEITSPVIEEINPNNAFNFIQKKEEFYPLFLTKLKVNQVKYTNDCSHIISFLSNLMIDYQNHKFQGYELMANFLFDLIIDKEEPWTNYLAIDESLGITNKQVRNLLAYRITNRIGSTFVNLVEFLRLFLNDDNSLKKWNQALTLILSPTIELKEYLEMNTSSELASKYNILKYDTDKIDKIALDALINGEIVIRKESLEKKRVPFNREIMKKVVGCDMANPYNAGLSAIQRYQDNFFINQRSSLFVNKMKTYLYNLKSTNPAKMLAQGKDHLIIIPDEKVVWSPELQQYYQDIINQVAGAPTPTTTQSNNNDNGQTQFAITPSSMPVLTVPTIPTVPTITIPPQLNDTEHGKILINLFQKFVEKVSFNLGILLKELPESQDVHLKIEEIINHCIVSYGKVLEEYGQNISGSPSLTEINSLAIFSLEFYLALNNLRKKLEDNQQMNLSDALSILNILKMVTEKGDKQDLYDLDLIRNLDKKGIIIEGVGYDKNTALTHPVRDYVLKIFYSVVVDPSIRIQNAVQDLMTNPKFEKDTNLIFTMFYNMSYNVWHYKFYTGSLANRINTSHELLPRIYIYLMKNLALNKKVELMDVPYSYFYMDLSGLNMNQLAELGLERFLPEDPNKKKGVPVTPTIAPTATPTGMPTLGNNEILPTMVLQAGDVITPTPTMTGITTPTPTMTGGITTPTSTVIGGITTPIFEDGEMTTNPNQPTNTLEQVTETPTQSIMEDIQTTPIGTGSMTTTPAMGGTTTTPVMGSMTTALAMGGTTTPIGIGGTTTALATNANSVTPTSIEEEIKKRNNLLNFLVSQEDNINQMKYQPINKQPEYLYSSSPMEITASGIDGVSNIYSPEILINLRR